MFDCIRHLLDAGKPTEIHNVAEELKITRQLDQIGGYAFLTQVSSRIPTTAQACYWIEKVREQALLREIIRDATAAVETCYNFTGGIDEHFASIERRMQWSQRAGTANSILARLEASRYDPAHLSPDVVPVFGWARWQSVPVAICPR